MAFIKHEVVPDVFDVAPPALLEVTYPNNVQVDGGNILTPTQVKDEPVVKWQADSDAAYYLVSMIDLDSPNRQDPQFRAILHWIVGNIPGNGLDKGEVLTEYLGSGPRQGSGLHRYVLVLYKQPGKVNFTESKISKTSAEGRRLFSIRDFAKKYNLGEPVAGNLYQAEWDEYVPTLHKQLGVK